MFEQKFVHLDMKGSPPLVDHLKAAFPFMKQWGATGVCIEWEDMLPFEGRFEVIRSTYAYSRDDITGILNAAAESGLAVMPLVQTFGHLEFLLKHDAFAEYRENPDDTMALCPSHDGAVSLIRELVDQVIDMHPGIREIHLGADEVWNLGTCPSCAAFVESESKAALFLKHMKPLLEHVQSRGLQSLIWDDMLRTWPEDTLAEISKLTAPVVWKYGTNIDERMPDGVWGRYSSVVPNRWAASAFKGADGTDIIWPHLENRVLNHQAWAKRAEKMPFSGIILTGWSRYSHFRAQCEILPATLPALALCLAVLDSGEYSDALRRSVFQKLGLGDHPLMHATTDAITSMPEGDFPGAAIYRLVGKLQGAHQLLKKIEFDSRTLDPRLNGGRRDVPALKKIAELGRRAVQIAGEVKEELPTPLSAALFPEDVKEFIVSKIDALIANAGKIADDFETVIASKP